MTGRKLLTAQTWTK